MRSVISLGRIVPVASSFAVLFAVACCTSSALAAKKPAASSDPKETQAAAQGNSFLEPREAGESDALAAKKKAAEQADSTRRAAEDLVAQALAAEAAGDPAARHKLLREALNVDPQCESAHWQMGDLRVGDEWKSIRQASVETDRAGVVKDYRNRRASTPQNAEAQYKLSKWCNAMGLDAQERAHLVFVLQLQPNHLFATNRLKAIRREAEQRSHGEIELARRKAKEAAATFKDWRPKLVSLRRDAESRDPARRGRGLQALSAVNDVAALPAIENVFADAEGEVGSAVVKSLSTMDDQRAVDSLVRYSVNAQNTTVRADAAKALAARSMFSYVPSMMSILVPPTRMAYSSAFNSRGDLGYRLTLYQEGVMADVEMEHTMSDQDFVRFAPVSRTQPTERTLVIDEARLRQRTMQTINATRNIEATNRAREARNKNIAEALRVSTGNDLDDAPTSWWNWWLDHNEIYRSYEKPVVSSETEAQISLAQISHPECFAAGTTVWTMTGPMPIEQVVVGESVLSQNTRTGELGYKLVLATTIRPVSPLVVIQAGKETIHATRGHPFWVAGIGWQMAKELKAGQWLHSAGGPVELKSVEDKGEALAYNMLLEDFNTYFVTDSMLLVHDNLIREVSPATVPGMTKAPAMVAAEKAAD